MLPANQRESSQMNTYQPMEGEAVLSRLPPFAGNFSLSGTFLQVAFVIRTRYSKHMRIHGSISHSRLEETPEAKVRWFRSLTMSERMEMLCSFTDLAITANPALQERKNAQSIAGRIQVISEA